MAIVSVIGGSFSFSDHPLGSEMPDENQVLQEGKIVFIDRYEHDEKWWVASLYIRQHLVDRLQKVRFFLNHIHQRRLYVTGAPGCGKTCFFWLWAGILMKQNKRVLFIQHRIKSDCQIWILENGVRRRLTSLELQKENLEKAVNHLLETQARKFDVCILDGVRSNHAICEVLMSTLTVFTGSSKRRKIAKLILVTSLQFHIPDSESDEGDAFMTIDSWRKEDYEKAVWKVSGPGRAILLDDWKYLNSSQTEDDPTKTDDEKVLEAMRQKYDYAGGCARFMFDKNIKDLRIYLDAKCGSVGDWTLFAKTYVPESKLDAVNTLMQQFYSEREHISMYTPVSKYVLRLAYANCRGKLTAAVKAVGVATGNGSLLGWAFELRQRDIIDLVLKDNLELQKEHAPTRLLEAFGIDEELALVPIAEAFFDGSTITVKDQGGTFVSGSVIWCTKFNQELFDAAFYFENTLVTLQFTAGLTHSLGLEHVKPIRAEIINKGFQVEKIVHLGVVPEENDGIYITGYQGIKTRSAVMADAASSSEAGTVSVVQHVGNLKLTLEQLNKG